MEEFLQKLSEILGCAHSHTHTWRCVSPVLGQRSLKNVSLKGPQIISLLGLHTCVRPALAGNVSTMTTFLKTVTLRKWNLLLLRNNLCVTHRCTYISFRMAGVVWNWFYKRICHCSLLLSRYSMKQWFSALWHHCQCRNKSNWLWHVQEWKTGSQK